MFALSLSFFMALLAMAKGEVIQNFPLESSLPPPLAFKNYTYYPHNITDVKPFGNCDASGTSWSSNTYTLHAKGEAVVNRPVVEGMNLLTRNCTVGFKMFVSGEQDGGGSLMFNFGAGANCLLNAKEVKQVLLCDGLGVAFSTSPLSTSIAVNVGPNIIQSTTLNENSLLSFRGKTVDVMVQFITYDVSNSDALRGIEVLLDHKVVFSSVIPWSIRLMNEKGVFDEGMDWSTKMTFVGYPCFSPQRCSSSDQFVISHLWYLCGDGVFPTPTRKPTNRPTLQPTSLPTHAPTNQPTIQPTALPTASPTTKTCDLEYMDPWVFPLDHFKLLFDAQKHGHEVHLTEKGDKFSFGMAYIPPALSNLIGFGLYGVNMTFDISFEPGTPCSSVGFILNYGSKNTCMFDISSNDVPSPTPQPNPSPSPYHPPGGYPTQPIGGSGEEVNFGTGVLSEKNEWKKDEVLVTPPLPLPNPIFSLKPVPWPKPCGYIKPPTQTKSPLTRPNDLDIEAVPDCDGISLAIISSGSDISGLFIARKEELLKQNDLSFLQGKRNVSIKLEYHHSGDKERIRFFLNDIPLTPDAIDFKLDSLAVGSQVSPKLTLSAASGSCTGGHIISRVSFEMEKVLVPEECECLSQLIYEEMSQVDSESTELETWNEMRMSAEEAEPSLTGNNAMMLSIVPISVFVVISAAWIGKHLFGTTPSNQYEPL
jgi:hypothetical protein